MRIRAHLIVNALVWALATGCAKPARASDAGVVGPTVGPAVEDVRESAPAQTTNCASNPPPMDLAEWQRLVTAMRAPATEKARVSKWPLSEIALLPARAEICDVMFTLTPPASGGVCS